jgi:hypothetical protein
VPVRGDLQPERVSGVGHSQPFGDAAKHAGAGLQQAGGVADVRSSRGVQSSPMPASLPMSLNIRRTFAASSGVRSGTRPRRAARAGWHRAGRPGQCDPSAAPGPARATWRRSSPDSLIVASVQSAHRPASWRLPWGGTRVRW